MYSKHWDNCQKTEKESIFLCTQRNPHPRRKRGPNEQNYGEGGSKGTSRENRKSELCMVRGLLSHQISKPKSLIVPRAAGAARSQVLTQLPQAEPGQFRQLQKLWCLSLKTGESTSLLRLWEVGTTTWKRPEKLTQPVLISEIQKPSKALWWGNGHTVAHSCKRLRRVRREGYYKATAIYSSILESGHPRLRCWQIQWGLSLPHDAPTQ